MLRLKLVVFESNQYKTVFASSTVSQGALPDPPTYVSLKPFQTFFFSLNVSVLTFFIQLVSNIEMFHHPKNLAVK